MGEARAIKYNLLNKKSTALIPPVDDSVAFYSARPNYLTTIFKHFAKPDAAEPPFNHGWSTDNDGTISAKNFLSQLSL